MLYDNMALEVLMHSKWRVMDFLKQQLEVLNVLHRVSLLLSAEDSDPVVLWSGEVDRYICVVSHGTAATGVETDPLRPSFFAFILLFWNQILTCLSVRPSVAASSSRLGLQRHCLEVHVEEFLTLKG